MKRVLACVCIAIAGALTAQVIFLALELALNRVFGQSGILTTGIAGLVCALLLLWAMLKALPVQGGTGGGPFATVARPLLSVTEGGGARHATSRCWCSPCRCSPPR